jgi:hypothetical protein
VPGHTLKGLEGTVCDQKSFVDAERGVHGVFSLNAHSSEVVGWACLTTGYLY